MRFTWTLEKDHRWVLRQPNGGARAVIKHREDEWGYVCFLLEVGFPGCGPFKSASTCAQWIEAAVKRDIDVTAEFGELPRTTWRSPHNKTPPCRAHDSESTHA